jgi:hypothetical protein
MAEFESEEGIVKEALTIFQTARQEGITLRILGGIAFKLRCPSSSNQKLKRHYQDIDFIGRTRQRSQIGKLLGRLGYTPRIMFNTLQQDRMIFEDQARQRRVDVFLEVFNMSHKLDFSKRILLDDLTLPLADLLLTKLQVFEFTERDLKDVFALLKDYELTTEDSDNGINTVYVSKLCSRNWNLCKGVKDNLEKMERLAPSYFLKIEDQVMVLDKITRLKNILEQEPKSMKWRLRGIVGERLRWYELPEEIH